MTPAEYKLCVHNVIPKATTKKATQRDVLENIINKSKWNSKKCLNNQQKNRKVEKRKQKNRGKHKAKNKMADLSQQIIKCKWSKYTN